MQRQISYVTASGEKNLKHQFVCEYKYSPCPPKAARTLGREGGGPVGEARPTPRPRAQGKITRTLEKSGNGITYDIVMLLVNSYQGKGHHIYVDNFYTSPVLFTALWNAGFGACGTLRCNRTGTPDEIKKAPRMAKGDIITARTDRLLFLKWKDKREAPLPLPFMMTPWSPSAAVLRQFLVDSRRSPNHWL